MSWKYNFLSDQEQDEPLRDSFVVRIHFLYSWTDSIEFLFQNYQDALSILEEDTSSIIEWMEVWWLTDPDSYWEILNVYKQEDWKEYIIADIHLDVLEQNWIDYFWIEKFTNNLIDTINKSEYVDFLRIFRDDRQIENYKRIYEQIYKLEMKLREIISQIFFNKYYPPEIDNFIKDLKLDHQNTYKKLWKDQSWKDIKTHNLNEKNENIFFYLLFSDYWKLTELKDLNDYELKSALQTAENFEDWQQKIFSRGIIDEEDKSFLEKIQEDLEIIEDTRNAIMHCRNLTDEALQNYSISRERLLKKIEEFEYWEDEEEFWLEVWKKYESLQDLPNFKKWEKYELKYWDKHDAVFIWEESEEVRFADKELLEYFKVWKD